MARAYCAVACSDFPNIQLRSDGKILPVSRITPAESRDARAEILRTDRKFFRKQAEKLLTVIHRLSTSPAEA